MIIGLRREDKSRHEARVPLVPVDVARLISTERVGVLVQQSPQRCFQERAFSQAGAQIVPQLTDASIILGIKEIPPTLLEPNKTYLFFSHTIKGQSYNMPMLRRIMELGSTLIDYERIVDEQNRRLVYFGNYAGLAGMIDALWALGRRLQEQGIPNPFLYVRRALEYTDLAHAKAELARIGERIRRDGLPPSIQPLIVGFAGYGHVSQGAQEILDLLPVETISPDTLAQCTGNDRTLYKVVFQEQHMVQRRDGRPFVLQDYYDHPELYESRFFDYVPQLAVLMNCIYWAPKYPRLVTVEQLRKLFSTPQLPRLRVIGDITCDIEGSIQCTVKATEPDNPVYVYEPSSGRIRDGVVGEGPVVLAVDILPCELPVDSSTYFSRTLYPFILPLARTQWQLPLTESRLPPELQRATIVYHGQLTPPYEYLHSHLQAV
ncbi:MAG: hypothetical protein HJJLKODD_02804 [Phycisphaerae bacterium]|nr:hypothetical protein [Phycisphaerae bacterium]